LTESKSTRRQSFSSTTSDDRAVTADEIGDLA